MGNIIRIKDQNNVDVFPLTHERGVRDSNGTTLETKLGQKQDTLVSGTNIKTVNNQSIVGSGNITIDSGSDIDTVSVSVDNNTGTPSATGSVSGSTLTLSFTNLKGATGEAGPAGADGATGPQGPAGPQGNSGYTGDIDELELVNNLVDGGETAALSAEQGVVLDNKIIGLYQYFEAMGQKVPYVDKKWLDTAYGIGDNLVTVNGTNYPYNGWAPNCAHYDYVRQRIMFLQCHRRSHTGAYTNSQLWAINPYNILDAELIAEFAPYSSDTITPLAFDIDANGVYWVMDREKIYKSTDRGLTWTVRNFATAFSYSYGLYIINGKFYAARDGGQNDIYYTSVDEGVTWEEHHFNIDASYNAYNEAQFCYFNGTLYASLRGATDANGLLLKQTGSDVWTVISDQLPNINSNCHMFATKDKLLYAAINRNTKVLSYGVLQISGNTVTIVEKFSFDVSDFSASGDFHSPTLVYTTEFAAITFMCGGFNAEYQSCNNACLVSYLDYERNENPSVTFDDNGLYIWGWASYNDSPYIGAAPTIDSKGYVTAVTTNNIYDTEIEHPNSFPLEGTNRIWYLPSKVNITAISKYDADIVNGEAVGARTQGYNDIYRVYAKILYKCAKNTEDTTSIGSVVPSGGIFSHAVKVTSSSNNNTEGSIMRLGNPIKTTKVAEQDRVVFTAIDDCVFTLTIPASVTPRMYHHICYSLDGGKTWVKTLNVTSTEVTVTTPTIKAGSKVLWKGLGCRMATGDSAYSHFGSTGRFSVSGNSLALFHDDFVKYARAVSGAGYELFGLFKDNTYLTSVSASFLPATIVGRYAYHSMFSGCTALTSAPNLPATLIGTYAYGYMFKGCTALVTAMEELPATSINDYTYEGMFDGCSALTTAPIIRAEHFKSSGNCRNLFRNCSSLAYVKFMMLDDATQSLTLQNWLSGVSASGTLVLNSAAQWTIGTGASGKPSGWTLETASE